jgi:GNAT superfamily N-acetyltransferase
LRGGRAQISVEYSVEADDGWLADRDKQVRPEVLRAKVARGEYIVATSGDERIGFLRYSYMWSTVPFVDLVFVEPEHRNRGAARAMVDLLQAKARSLGRSMIMSSSQSDEPEPQAWHRRIGFRDAGAIVDMRPFQQVPGIIFVRTDEPDTAP